jgi:hypothetical protein
MYKIAGSHTEDNDIWFVRFGAILLSITNKMQRYTKFFITVNALHQRFSNFFQVRTTFISQNVLRTTLLLPPLKANLSFF